MNPEQTRELAMTVKALCDVRLACTVLMMVAAPAMTLGAESYLPIGVGLTSSYLLLWHWESRGSKWMQGWWLPAAETLTAMLLFVEFGASGLGGVYLGATMALLACAAGLRGLGIALGTFVPVVCLAIAGYFPRLGGASVRDTVWLLSLVVMQVACGLVGLYLRTTLLSRVELAAQRRAAELAEALGSERLRLAQELHDGVAKTLHGSYLIAESLARQLALEGHQHTPRAEELAQSLEVARRESRELLRERRQLPDEDLVPLCRLLVDRWAERHPETTMTAEFDDGPVVVTSHVRHEVLRVLAELLENVRRHSRSSSVAVTLRCPSSGGRLVVADRGVGIAELDPEALRRGGHFGLAGVWERAERVGGACRVVTGPTGTRVEVDFPVVRDEEELAS